MVQPLLGDSRLSAASLSKIGQLVIHLSVPSYSLTVPALVDSGASDSFMDLSFARSHGFPLVELPFPRGLRLFDGGLAPAGPITQSCTIPFIPPNGFLHKHNFLLTTLDSIVPLVLGIDWLALHNPWIDWKSLKLRFSKTP